MKSKFTVLVVSLAIFGNLAVSHAATQSRAARRAKKASVCGNPKIACKGIATFNPNDLPFRYPENSIIFDTEFFYAVVLRSLKAKDDSCDVFISEDERLQVQASFPENKVFASRCADPENLFYTNISPSHRILAVYAGATLPEAKRILAAVKATGKYPGANIRRMRTGFNGT